MSQLLTPKIQRFDVNELPWRSRRRLRNIDENILAFWRPPPPPSDPFRSAKIDFSIAIWRYEFQGGSVGGLCGCMAASIFNVLGEFHIKFKYFLIWETLNSTKNVTPNE